tara:strand:+ start:634 stop:2748 length:2115 start_codon:yes stop_codon:yes gene_type:complete
MKYFFTYVLFLCAFAKANAQEIPHQSLAIDFQSVKASIDISPNVEGIKGTATYSFNVLRDVDSVYLDAPNYERFKLIFNDAVTNDGDAEHIILKYPFKAGESHTMVVDWYTRPKQTFYKVNHDGESQFWTQGQGKYTSHWMPSLDDMNDKMEFDITVKSPSDYTVITNGNLAQKEIVGENTTWTFDMEQPMSSYLTAVIVGKYDKKTETSRSGVPLEFYYYPKDSLKVEPTYRYSKKIFDFLESEIGVAYPWKNYKQVPVKDFLYAGMENTGTTIFSDSFVVDDLGFEDRNYVNVNAHELAHQWFGNLVTETKSEHHWLHEGFATYYALLAEREIFGEDYFYYKLYETAEQLKELSDQGKGQQLVAAGGSSLTYYQKGAWAIHILREKVGKDAFAKAVRAYLLKHQYTNVTTEDFMEEVVVASGMDLTDFSKNWLYQSAFQADEALEALKKSDFIKRYFEIQALRSLSLEQKVNQLMRAIESNDDYIGQEAVYQLEEEPLNASLGLYVAAIESDNLFIRQAVAESIKLEYTLEIPRFDALLTDVSYVTRELSLFKKWLALRQDPKGAAKQVALLNLTDNTFGFSDGNVRTMWLALSLVTQGFNEDEEAVSSRYEELKSYTAPSQAFQLRLQAFQYFSQIQIFEHETIGNLVEACVHANWRFRESARSLLTQVLENNRWKEMLLESKLEFSEKEKAYLKKIGLDI